MTLRLNQLVYTSFLDHHFRLLTSAQVPPTIQQAFMEEVVQVYWTSSDTDQVGYEAAYVHQVTPVDTLFGWMYVDRPDDLTHEAIPYFMGYHLSVASDSVPLENILTCLQRGPIAAIDQQSAADQLASLTLDDAWSYEPARTGILIPSVIRARLYIVLEQVVLEQRELHDLFYSSTGHLFYSSTEKENELAYAPSTQTQATLPWLQHQSQPRHLGVPISLSHIAAGMTGLVVPLLLYTLFEPQLIWSLVKPQPTPEEAQPPVVDFPTPSTIVLPHVSSLKFPLDAGSESQSSTPIGSSVISPASPPSQPSPTRLQPPPQRPRPVVRRQPAIHRPPVAVVPAAKSRPENPLSESVSKPMVSETMAPDPSAVTAEPQKIMVTRGPNGATYIVDKDKIPPGAKPVPVPRLNNQPDVAAKGPNGAAYIVDRRPKAAKQIAESVPTPTDIPLVPDQTAVSNLQPMSPNIVADNTAPSSDVKSDPDGAAIVN